MSLKVIELFSGIGAPAMALKNNDISFETIGISEIDKGAIEAYNLIHGETKNFGDITKIEELPYCDFLHASSPCQGFSMLGKKNGTKGASGLIYEYYRLLKKYSEKKKLPKFLSYENVPELKTKYPRIYDELVENMKDSGYNIYSAILKATNYDNPTNRTRLFIIGIRRDIDDGSFKMPDSNLSTSLSISSFLVKDDPSSYVSYPFHPAKKSSDKNAFYLGYLEKGVNRRTPSNRVFDKTKYCPTITTSTCYYIVVDKNKEIYRPLYNEEFWYIMGFSKENWQKINKNFSKSKINKMIGNSIALGPLEAIYKNLKPLIEKECD